MNLFLKRVAALLIAVQFIFPINVFALPTGWKINTKLSQINFAAIQNGAPVTGKFNDFSGEIYFSPDDLAASKAKIIVDINSLDTSYQELTDTLEAAEWFDMKVFPTAVFQASSFTKTGDNQFSAKGTLTIRDQTVPVTLKFTFKQPTADTALVQGSTTIKRTAFGVGQGEWASVNEVQDDVRVNFTVNAAKITAPAAKQSPQ